jgi:hypothetical protein
MQVLNRQLVLVFGVRSLHLPRGGRRAGGGQQVACLRVPSRPSVTLSRNPQIADRLLTI